ncbi:uncharacterized protein PGRI_035940 [Penicillium griseofulvum]|uniref:Transcription factor n=1 Tax=Penicillium patulum TaxID=5078 RepID=A0A135LCZ8_PENPA|nr:uncharacterized protein PGRI_035940 [Penicillium griseofulvum]KXG46848.1 hypothetical protein PGRI_035940 [Penicillium griseofulvum]
MHTKSGGYLAIDEKSQQQVRMIWHSLWVKKMYLTLQSGFMAQSLSTFYDPPMPLDSHINHTMQSYPDTRSSSPCAFFFACTTLFINTHDLVTAEKHLHVMVVQCPFKWLPTADFTSFHRLDASLSCWFARLPKLMQWRGATVEFAMQRDDTIRRLALLVNIRYMYFRLRQYRPFLILAWRFSHPCACEMNHHLTSKDLDSVQSSPFLPMVYSGAIRCVNTAQDILKTLYVSYEKQKDDDAKCEQLDYLYAVGLVLIAAMRMRCLMSGAQLGACRTAAVAESMAKMENDFLKIDTLLRYYQENCDQAPQLKQRIQHCRDTLALIRLQSVSSDGIISDQDITFPYNAWCCIYDRLDIDVPCERFSRGNPANGKVHGRRMTFGWLESLPFDLDGQGE